MVINRQPFLILSIMLIMVWIKSCPSVDQLKLENGPLPVVLTTISDGKLGSSLAGAASFSITFAHALFTGDAYVR